MVDLPNFLPTRKNTLGFHDTGHLSSSDVEMDGPIPRRSKKDAIPLIQPPIAPATTPSHEHAGLLHPAGNDRLITTLQKCFSELLEKQDEQADRLHKAVTDLKPKVPATDKKTTFWNLYNNLADDHDKEFHERYSTDLDASLIFAGLFSAIDSAFIIQIQPEIQPRGTRLIIIIAQSLLYISLGSTLLAALLAVLGKQWLMYYSAAGERGTIEARGLERQRKFDGLRKWKFDTIMQLFPLLLHVGLLLFATGLSVYLWTKHFSLAIIVLSFTSLGVVSYILLLVSAVVSPDSPFQTPLAPFVTHLISTRAWLKTTWFIDTVTVRPRSLIRYACAAVSNHIHQFNDNLPIFSKRKSNPENVTAAISSEEPATLFIGEFPKTSPEVPAVLWVLETSADPHTVAVAAEIVVDLQWPRTLDLGQQLTRLRDSILACFDASRDGPTFILNHIRNGMAHRAIHFGRAYCTLRCVHSAFHSNQGQESQFRHSNLSYRSHAGSPWGKLPAQFDHLPELANVIRILNGQPNLVFDSDASLATKWALHIIPSLQYGGFEWKLWSLKDFLTQFDRTIPNLGPAGFSDYLFCVYTFLSPESSREISWMDKRTRQTPRISTNTAADIISTTGRLAKKLEDHMWHRDLPYHRRQSIVYQFCSDLPGSDGCIDIILATGFLTETYSGIGWPKSGDSHWVYRALDNISAEDDHRWRHRITGIAGLLQALLYYDTPPAPEHVHHLLRALTISGDISKNATRILLRNNIRSWFEDDELGPMLQGASVWASLTRVALELNDDAQFIRIIRMGYTLVAMPDWKSQIGGDLCSWITIFFRVWNWELVEKYNYVLERIWNPDGGDYAFMDDTETALGLTFVALCKVWEDMNFTSLGGLHESVRWLRCTSSAIFHRVYEDKSHDHWIAITSSSWFKTQFSTPLRNSLVKAAAAARREVAGESSTTPGEIISPEMRKGLTSIVEILHAIAGELETWDHWKNLRDHFDEEIDALQTSFQAMPAA
ncbi:hypothetical protein B0H19DRAFT_1350036 [Mycena capillaripes]|nr:hypothetical protein B0H19DRAFT_1350036 [Mycena capillaripes]